jgi:drug/metabolite transporter (DMT)-like permease
MTEKQGKRMLMASMLIFGTVGIFRRWIPYPSGFIALVRAILGAVFLSFILLLKGQKPDWASIRKNALLLLLSGTALGFNWIFLFESYAHTSVATATLCYYLAPILVILLSPLLFREPLTGKKILCALAALCGMVLVSGVADTTYSGRERLKGIGFGLAAAVLYSSVIVLNKKLLNMDVYDKTVSQLVLSAAVMLPYVLLTENTVPIETSLLPLLLLNAMGTVHTGIAYWLYFGSMGHLKAQTIALYSYIDPILAIVLSMVILREPMTFSAAIGAALILGTAYLSER